MKRKFLSIILCCVLCITTGASASLASLEDALAPLLSGHGAVQLSVKLNLKTLMPFDDVRLDLINRVLAHTELNMLQDDSADKTVTGFRLNMAGSALFEATEQVSQGAYLLQTSLLPNRMLFSTQASPMDILLLSQQEDELAVQEAATANTSDVEEAFDMLEAVEELQSCYKSLTDLTVPLTEQNKVSYTIENIGKGRLSYVAKLTTDQCTELEEEIRTVISCGMDAEYREELSQVTFARGFTVALYQDADGEDISLYIKGTIVYPDGDRRTLKWQWGFTPDGQTQTFLHYVYREEGRRDTRNIQSLLERSQKDGSYTLECETSANLRRGSWNETSTLIMDLSGTTGDAASCKGSVTRETGGTYSGDDLDTTLTAVTVDLALAAGEAYSTLTGSASYLQQTNKKVNTELELSFPQTVETVQGNTATGQGAQPDVEISILPADTQAALLAAQTPTETVEETQTEQPEYLVGSPPVGLYEYEIPSEMITINMDSTQPNIHQSLMNEAAQRLAGNLVLAILNLPAEDREFLSDGMTETDYAIFLAMLD